MARLPGLGKVRLGISFEHADRRGTYVVLATNQRAWSAHRIIATDLLRWPTDTFYQDGKGHRGLDTYRTRSAAAMGKHGGLVFVASSFLHLACLPPPLAPGSPPARTIGEACRQQAQALLQNLRLYAHDRLLGGVPIEEVLTTLFAKHQRMAPT